MTLFKNKAKNKKKTQKTPYERTNKLNGWRKTNVKWKDSEKEMGFGRNIRAMKKATVIKKNDILRLNENIRLYSVHALLLHGL